jgi:hypothetical protein
MGLLVAPKNSTNHLRNKAIVSAESICYVFGFGMQVGRTLSFRGTAMSVFRIHFSWKDKEYVLKAEGLDMTHPYFVAIKDLVLPEEGVLINPADDDLRKKFGRVRQLMLPFQAVSLIEEYKEDPDRGDGKSAGSAKRQGRGEVVPLPDIT